MTMVRGQYAQLMAPGAHGVFVQWRDTLQRKTTWSEVFHVETSKKAYEDEFEMVGLPPMPEKPENNPVAYAQFIQGGTKRYIHLTYALAARYSWELMEDEQYGIVKTGSKALVRSSVFTKEMVIWNTFNQGFSNVITIDGKSLFHNQHPLQGGPAATNIGPGLSGIISLAGTYPNRPAVDIDVSLAAIQTMTNHFERLVDAQGMPVVYKPNMILAAPENRFLLRELLGSPGKPGTATNEINSLLGEELRYGTVPYFTSASAWYAVCDKSQHQLKVFERKQLDEDYDDDFDTDATKQKAKMRFSVGASHWMGTWGSNGP